MLEWQLRNYKKLKHLDKLIAQHASGAHIPFLDSMPSIHPNNLWLMVGYETLAGQRAVIDGRPQPIPVSEIAAYANYVGMADEADREDFLRIMCRMDTIALSFANKAAMEEQKKAQRKSDMRRR